MAGFLQPWYVDTLESCYILLLLSVLLLSGHRTSHNLVHNLVPQNPYMHDIINGARIDYISEVPVNLNKSFT